MNPLRRALQSLKTHQAGPWRLVVSPDPNRFPGALPRENEREWHMKLDAKSNLDDYEENGLLFSYASNDTAKGSSSKAGQPMATEWVRIVGDGSRKTADGRTINDLLREELRNFPSYPLHDARSAEKVAEDMEKRLGEIARFERVEDIPSPSPK
ncbi:hypothetical protein H1R20_g3364, partial [Candolleomyces eurysporus]